MDGGIGIMGDPIEESMLVRIRDNGCDSRSGSDNVEGSGDDQEVGDNHRRLGHAAKKYHRHTPQQIQQLELSFKECPHPDEKQRAELSRRLGLESKQIKFWFQNRRTQLKTQLERHENVILRQENDKLRAENELLKQSLSDPTCNTCGGPVVPGPVSYEQQQLRFENAKLKDEMGRVCALANKFIGRPIPPAFLPNSKLDLAIGRNGYCGLPDYDPSFSMGFECNPNFMVPLVKPMVGAPPFEATYDRSALADLAFMAMEDLIRKAQADCPFWIKSWNDSEVFNQEEYARACAPFFAMKSNCCATDATRGAAIIPINSMALTEILMDVNRFTEAFSTIVARAFTTDVISNGVNRSRNGELQVMFAEFQVLSPLVPLRQVKFLRFCKQHSDNMWVVVDVSVDAPDPTNPMITSRRLPSGCLILEMPNGFCKVTWVEHAEYEENIIHHLYRHVISSGRGFGAPRWLATLQRYCECISSLTLQPIAQEDQQVLSLVGRRSMLKLAHRMVESFCSGVSGSSLRKWEKLAAGSMKEDTVTLARDSIDEPGEPNGVILSSATSAWLPVSQQKLFEFMRDEKSRCEWDILTHGGQMQEIANVIKGQHRGNCVSLFRCSPVDDNVANANVLILQETWNDSTGSLLVYSPVELPSMSIVMNGGDSSCVVILPSGFVITPDYAFDNIKREGERAEGHGSLLTVGFQMLVNVHPPSKLTMEPVETLKNLVSSTMQRIKAALGLDLS